MLRTLASGLAAAAIALVGAYLPSARADPCTAEVGAAGAGWTTVPLPAPGAAALRDMAHLRCDACQPPLSLLVAAGPAPSALRDAPHGRLGGLAWARAMVADPAARQALLQSVVRSELRSSPGCRLEGEPGEAIQIGNMGFVATPIRAACNDGRSQLSAIFYSSYDQACLYQVQLVWEGTGRLPPEADAAARRVLETMRFGR